MIYHAADVPVWVAILVAFFMTSWGTGGVMMASILFFTFASGRPVVHEVLIGIFVTVTTPVTFMLLARAALHRDRMEKNPLVPRRKGEEFGLEDQDPSKG